MLQEWRASGRFRFLVDQSCIVLLLRTLLVRNQPEYRTRHELPLLDVERWSLRVRRTVPPLQEIRVAALLIARQPGKNVLKENWRIVCRKLACAQTSLDSHFERVKECLIGQAW